MQNYHQEDYLKFGFTSVISKDELCPNYIQADKPLSKILGADVVAFHFKKKSLYSNKEM